MFKNTLIRNHGAKIMRQIHKLLLKNEPETPPPSCTCSLCELVDNSPTCSDKLFSACMVGVCLLLAAFILIANCPKAHAEIPEEQAVCAIIGEAENQGYVGMLSLAHALRNRSSLHGVYGAASYRVRHHLYSPKIYAMAHKAWIMSEVTQDFTKGAQGWGNAQDLKEFARCKWWRNCTVTFAWKDHYFYRRVLAL